MLSAGLGSAGLASLAGAGVVTGAGLVSAAGWAGSTLAGSAAGVLVTVAGGIGEVAAP